MNLAALLLPLALVVPLVLAALAPRAPQPSRWLGPAPWPALAAVLLLPTGTAIRLPFLDLTLALDRPGGILLAGAALLWSAAGFFAARSMAQDRRASSFAAWWLLTLAGCLGVFLAADLAGFYLVFAVASLAAYGLVVHERTPQAGRAGRLYVVLALVGEAALLLGFVLLAAGVGGGNALIADAVRALPGSPREGAVLGLLVLGFALKMGLLPVHVWLPVAHPAAPTPASAVLSGVVVKAGVIGLIRFLPLGAGEPGWGGALQAIGLATAFAGVLFGIVQPRTKTILAYSTVSQMGLVAFALGTGLAQALPSAADDAALYALHHMLAKGALFMAVGIVGVTERRLRRPLLVVTALLALGMAGLPLTGGSVAKMALKPPAGDSTIAWLLALSSAGSAALMLVFMARLAGLPDPEPHPPLRASLLAPWLVVAALSMLAPCWVAGIMPWAGLAPAMLAGTMLPIVAGAAAAWIVWRLRGSLPAVPEGDIVALAEPLAGSLARQGRGLAAGVDRALSSWPMAGTAMLVCGLAVAALAWSR